ncbi:MAG: hypothetical protein HWE18_02025 [Gammaproteobacteria bacterium]|nr:hypothetical protein [Gammaproteobacteria bacterium]
MKKTFSLEHPKKSPERMVEAIKHEIKKYMKRERNKALPEDTNYWAFDCKFGNSQDVAEEVRPGDFNKLIDAAVAAGQTSFFVEILARADFRVAKPKAVEDDEDFDE